MVPTVCNVARRARSAFPIATGTEPVTQVEYGALLQTLAGLGMDGTLPPAVPDSYESNEEFLRALHHVLMEARRAHGHPFAAPSVPSPVSWRMSSSRAGGGDRRYARLPRDREALPD